MIEYEINRGVGKSPEFRGLTGQYLIVFGVGIAGAIILFIILKICGAPMFLIFPLVLGGLGFLLWNVFAFQKKYGQHGLMKKQARSYQPHFILKRNTICSILNYRKNKN